MTLDQYGIAHFWDGGESDAGPGEGDGGDADSAADAAAADAGGIDAGATDASLGAAGVENAMDALGLAGLTQDAEVSPGGMTYGELAALDAMGFGQMEGVNPNNPTQSVEEALAAQNFHAALSFALPTIMGMAVPGLGPALSLAKGIGSLTSGQISPAQFGGQLGIAALSQVTGIPTGVIGPALSGNIGQAATNAGLSLGQMALSQATGLPPGIVGLGMQAAFGGQPGAIGQGATSIGNTAGGQIDFSGVGGSESYDPTEVLKASV